jgi:hypothetical protein
MLTLTNKNIRRTELNENKDKFLDQGEGRECFESCFLYNSTMFTKYFISLYTTPLFIVFGVNNVHVILYNQSNPNYPSYILALIT